MPPVRFSSWLDWRNMLAVPLALLIQINLFQWQSWVAILLCFNAGAMLGPSTRDLKNVWPMLILLFFIKLPLLISLALAALSLIFFNLILQIFAIVLLSVTRLVGRLARR
jgi:hypothetical protein